MSKDKRYNTVKKLIMGGFIKTFSEILDTIPKTVLTKDLGMHHQTFKKIIKNPERLSFRDAFRIASFIEIDEQEIMTLIYNECIVEKKAKRKK
jgi:plasmid maintenance system antidote protein VapI